MTSCCNKYTAKFQDLLGSKTKKLDIKNLVLKAIDTSHHCRTGKLGWMVESDGAMHWPESERWSSVDIPVHLFLQYSLVWGGFGQRPRPSQGGPQWSTNCRPVREFHRFLLRKSSRWWPLSLSSFHQLDCQTYPTRKKKTVRVHSWIPIQANKSGADHDFAHIQNQMKDGVDDLWSSRTAVSSNSYYRATIERAKEETREESARVTSLKQVPWVAAWASSPTACCCSFACWTLWAWQESIQVQASQDAQLWLWMWSATNAKALLWERYATEDMDYPIKLNKSRETMPLVTVKSRITNF